MNGLRALAIGLDAVVARAETAVIVVLVALLTAVTFAQVAARYVLGDPLIWSEEAARYLFVWVSMIGAALAIARGRPFRPRPAHSPRAGVEAGPWARGHDRSPRFSSSSCSRPESTRPIWPHGNLP